MTDSCEPSEDKLKRTNDINKIEKADEYNIHLKYNEILLAKINQTSNGQKQYIKRLLDNILNHPPDNAERICNFITAERNEINIKESTIEWHIKVLGQLLKFHNFKDFTGKKRRYPKLS